MKVLLQILFPQISLLFWANSQEIPPLAILSNLSYGSDPQQIMDIYLPGGRDTTVSKVVVLIHGGAWSAGNKESMFGYAVWSYFAFPRYAIVNMGYRLGTADSPGFPKQLEDIKLVLQYVTANQSALKIKPEFALVGSSAGGHLAMLYGYSVDKSQQVNAICNIVGPTDLTDPEYTNSTKYQVIEGVIPALVGYETFKQNPGLFAAVSPVYSVTRQSPPTISFFGAKDPLIPLSQATTLEDKLDENGVINKFYIYPDEGHGFANPTNQAHFFKKLSWFFKTYL